MKTRKEIREIFEAIDKTEDKSKSVRENMLRYCMDVEKMTEEEAAQVVNELIKGTSDFTESFKDINGKKKDEISNSLIIRLDEKLNGQPPEKVDIILQNLFLEVSALSIQQMNEVASNVGDGELDDMVAHIRSECQASLEGKTYEEKLDLIAEAVQNCGSLNALLALASDDRSFATAADLDDAISTAAENDSETAYVLDELESLRSRNYYALAEYISARHGTNPRYDSNVPAYNIGVSTAADMERRKIRAAARAGMITFENAAHLIGTVIGVALSLFLIMYVTCFIAGIFAIITGATTISTGLLTLGAYSLMTATGGWDGVEERGKKIGNVLAMPIIGIKNLAVRLIRGFCSIFNISLPKSKGEQMTGEEEDIAVEHKEKPVDPSAGFEDDDGEEQIEYNPITE